MMIKKKIIVILIKIEITSYICQSYLFSDFSQIYVIHSEPICISIYSRNNTL